MNKELVEKFVDAADRLVNLLATTPGSSPEWQERHNASVDEAYSRYDAARTALMGDPADDES